MSQAGLTLTLIARIPAEGVQAFRAYEAAVLPLLADHGGVLQRRLAQADGMVEIHLVWFPSPDHFTSFRADPRRAASAPMLERSKATVELFVVSDIQPTAFPSTARALSNGPNRP